MRRVGWAAAAVVCVILVIMVLLQVVAGLHEQALVERRPLSFEDLDRVSRQLASNPIPRRTPQTRPEQNKHHPTEGPDQDGGQLASGPSPGLTPQTRPEQDTHHPASAEAVTPLPTRLERVLTPEERTARFLRTGYGLSLTLLPLKAAESLLWSAGNTEGACRLALGIGTNMKATGDWDGARRYFSETIETSSNPAARRAACARLAWLEDDPETAVKLLELSCTGEDSDLGFNLANAVRLTQATGSEALAETYLARLKAEHPEDLHWVDELR